MPSPIQIPAMRSLMQIIEGAATTQPNANFARWFGNSQVLAPDGSPLVVYHGSNAHAYVAGAIDIFHTLPASGRGAAFFTSSKALAGEYGERVYAVYLRLENPLIVFGNGKSWGSLDHTTKVAGRVTDELRAHHQKRAREVDDLFRELDGDDLFRETGDGDAVPVAVRSKIPDHVGDLDGFGLGIIPDVEDGGVETDTIVKQARRLGYDGVIFRQIIDSPTHDRNLYKNTAADVYAVFRAVQVKSIANSGEWDRDDPDINA